LFCVLLLPYDYTWFLHALVLLLLLLYIYIRVYLLLAWYPRDVLVGPFILAEVRPPTLYITIVKDKHNWKPKDYIALKIAITKLSEKEIKDKLNTKKCKAIKKNL
jgi:hypothetical protein